VLVPGSGTFGMEAVARQFVSGRKALVIRNGWFSYRWTQIFDMGAIPSSSGVVLKAQRIGRTHQAPFEPPPIDRVVAAIKARKARRGVRAACGNRLRHHPARCLSARRGRCRAFGGRPVRAGLHVASGAMWVDMVATGVDVLVSAPQKGWSGPAGCALVMLGEQARQRIDSTTSTSFAANLRRWLEIMEAYEGGGHASTTPPCPPMRWRNCAT
jgi:aspartate aminotransferase-like enzyme